MVAVCSIAPCVRFITNDVPAGVIITLSNSNDVSYAKVVVAS